MQVKMLRTGSFAVDWHKENRTQCGWTGNNVLSYKVEIKADSSMLDSRGFIIDNMEINRYFADKYADVQDFTSCEEIAVAAVLDLKARLPKCFLISVSISGEPDAAWLTAEWESQDEADKSDLAALFALQQTRMAKATKLWQESTGRNDVLPDLGDLLEWLMTRGGDGEQRTAA